MLPHLKSTLGLVLLTTMLAGSAVGEEVQQKVGLLPTQNQAGRSEAAQSLESSFRVELGWQVSLVEPELLRDTMRRFRIRDLDQTPPELLTQASELAGARWLVSSTLHDADDRDIPTMSASIRVYDATSGEMIWSLFRGASGLDRRTVLGLGVVTGLEELAARVGSVLAADLLRDLVSLGSAGAVPDGAMSPTGEEWAVIPFLGMTETSAFANSEAITNLVRSKLLDMNVPMTSPNRLSLAMGQQGLIERGGVSDDLRLALSRDLGTNILLTGAVEIYDKGGFRGEPRPFVEISMRLIDAATGQILWTGALDRSGWNRPWPLALGRTYSRGSLASELSERLLGQMMKQQHRQMQRFGAVE